MSGLSVVSWDNADKQENVCTSNDRRINMQEFNKQKLDTFGADCYYLTKTNWAILNKTKILIHYALNRIYNLRVIFSSYFFRAIFEL